MPRSRYAMAAEYSPWYVGWANCDEEAANVLRDYYERPWFLPEDSRGLIQNFRENLGLTFYGRNSERNI